MEDLQVINDIVNHSVKETSYWSIVISSVVFITYTVVIRLFDYYKNKDKDKPLIEMSKAVKEVTNNVIKLNSVLDKLIQDNVKKDITKCKNTIELSFLAFENNMFQFCRDIIVHNNIDTNKTFIVGNISQKVNTEYYKIYAALSIYDIKEVVVATHLRSEWIDDITNDLISIIYNGQDKEARINQVANKLKLTTNSYCTLVSNKTFN